MSVKSSALRVFEFFNENMDEEDSKFSIAQLEGHTYRHLQQLAKSLGLPSNVKKMYLVQMIHAKKLKSDEECNNLVNKVKKERQKLSQVRKRSNRRKMHIQGTEVSSTSNSHSPPISNTPKRPGHIVVSYSPNLNHTIVKYKPRPSQDNPNTAVVTKSFPLSKDRSSSDRVLRSFNIKSVKNSNYVTNNPILEVIQSKNSVSPKKTKNEIVYTVSKQDTRYPKLNVTTQGVIKTYRPAIISTSTSLMRNLEKAQIPTYLAKASNTNPQKAQSSSYFAKAFNTNPQKAQIPSYLANASSSNPQKAQIPSYIAKASTTNPQKAQIPTYLVKPSNTNSQKAEIPSHVAKASSAVNTVTTIPAKRQRTLSGIYPLTQKETTPKINYEYIQSVGFRRLDGKISKINAIVQKSNAKSENIHPSHNIVVTMQDLINCNIDAQANTLEYTNSETNTPNNYESSTSNSNEVHFNKEIDYGGYNVNQRHYGVAYKENECLDNFSVYYHKKIRSEQVRSQRSYQREIPRATSKERLPKINDVFSRFNDITCDVTQPIYVQVSDESERINNFPLYVPKTSCNTNLLESLYNFRNQFVVNQPLLQIATTTNTKCVFSTPVMTTAVPQQSTTLASTEHNSSCERDNFCNDDMACLPRITDLLKFTDQDDNVQGSYIYDDDATQFSTSSSFERSMPQDLGATVTIPEMVEDALEIISQDGDYMERIGMDVRMQCVICSWAGPQIMLEYHVRKEHSDKINKQSKTEWTITFTLGSLVQRQHWMCQLLEFQSDIYVLAVKYGDGDCFVATLSSLSTEPDLPKRGSITIYNKVTGEPYSWEAEVQPIPPNMPYENETNCLKIELSKLNLLPNSANLKLLNGELVLKSPTKVVVGQPALNDIHIILFVKIFT